MAFDFVRFLNREGIRFVTEGPNVSRGNINISCPFCATSGNPDPSEHMGIELRTGYWACWRNKTHRGKRPHRLIMRLLRCTYEHAELMVSSGIYLDSAAFNPLKKPVKPMRPTKLQMPESFRPVVDYGNSARIWRYLRQRGYSDQQVARLVTRYDLRYETAATLWRERVIIPINDEDGLVSWTGRTISPTRLPRYKALPVDREKAKKEGSPLARLATYECLLDYDKLLACRQKRMLVVCEGPFDAMRIAFFTEKYGVRATCLFTNTLGDTQFAKLMRLRRLFARFGVMLDQHAEAQMMQVLRKLAPLRPEFIPMPNGVKDPALLSERQAKNLLGIE